MRTNKKHFKNLYRIMGKYTLQRNELASGK